MAWLLLLTALAFLVLGYHPFAEDGGIYGAAIAHRLQPSLFPWDAEWVEGHTRFSVFVPATAWLLLHVHLSLAWGLLLLQGVGLFQTLLAVLVLARLCFQDLRTSWWATLLVAISAGLPVAGTALYLIDPYVTARTFSTPLLLAAAACILRRRWLWAALFWATACVMHPLMAAWGSLPLALLLASCTSATPRQRRLTWIALTSAALLTLSTLSWSSPPASPLSRSLALTRGYWFLSAWHWYEWLGVVAPITLLAASAVFFRQRRSWTANARALAQAACTSSTIGTIAALLFAHLGGRNFAVARLQPMRTFHFTYAVLLLILAGSLYQLLHLRPAPWRHGLMCGFAVSVATAMMLSQRTLYRHSGWVEWPWTTTHNGYVQAFLWIQQHTGVRDRVALDAHYTKSPGEDAQGFRAVALRSTLPDDTKDAGIAAVVPTLEQSWLNGVRAQTALNTATDAQRIERLRAYGVQWLVLPASASTGFYCPYINASAKVCRLP